MVFWIYSGCLISFFTISPSGLPIIFINDLKDSPMKFYVQPDYSTAFDQIKIESKILLHCFNVNLPNSVFFPIDDLDHCVSNAHANRIFQTSHGLAFP